MSITRDAILQILAILFPPTCLACGRVEGIVSLPMALCSRCHRRLDALSGPRALGQRSAGSALSGLLSAWSYQPPFDAVVHGLKFGRLEFLGRDLAGGLHRILLEAKGEFDVVVPIPLHWQRRMARGYNQAETIAEPLARLLGLPLVRALRRQRATRAQAKLDRAQREANLRLAFAPVGHRYGTINARRVLLVDDVTTTGVTLETAARCLRDHGVRSVTAITAGRTPAPDNGVRVEEPKRDRRGF